MSRLRYLSVTDAFKFCVLYAKIGLSRIEHSEFSCDNLHKFMFLRIFILFYLVADRLFNSLQR